MTPQQTASNLINSGSLRLPYLFGSSENTIQIGDPVGPELTQELGRAPGSPGIFKTAARRAVSAVLMPFQVFERFSGAAARETERVGSSAAEAIKDAGSAAARGFQVGALLIVLLVGLWAISSAKRILG